MLSAVHAQDEPAGDEKPATGASEVKVTLLDAGQEPRVALRFRPEKGAVSEMEMVMRMQAKQTMNGVEMPSQKIPPMRMVVALNVDDVAENGDALVTGRFVETEVLDEPADRAAREAHLDPLARHHLDAIGGEVVERVVEMEWLDLDDDPRVTRVGGFLRRAVWLSAQ